MVLYAAEDDMFELWPHPLDKLIHVFIVLLKLCYVQ